MVLNTFSFFVIISPWKRLWPFILIRLNSLHLRMFCAKFGPVVLEKKIFEFRQCFIFLFRNYHPCKRAWPLIWTNLISLHPRMSCAKFGWNWPSGSGEEFFFLICLCIFAISFHLNRLKSPSPKDALCQVWLKLAHCYWIRRWICGRFTDGPTDDRCSEKFSSGELKL